MNLCPGYVLTGIKSWGVPQTTVEALSAEVAARMFREGKQQHCWAARVSQVMANDTNSRNLDRVRAIKSHKQDDATGRYHSDVQRSDAARMALSSNVR